MSNVFDRCTIVVFAINNKPEVEINVTLEQICSLNHRRSDEIAINDCIIGINKTYENIFFMHVHLL